MDEHFLHLKRVSLSMFFTMLIILISSNLFLQCGHSPLLRLFHSLMQPLQARTSHWLQQTMLIMTYRHIGQMNLSTTSLCSSTTSSWASLSVLLLISLSIIRCTLARTLATNFVVRSLLSAALSAIGDIPTHGWDWSLKLIRGCCGGLF